MQNKHNLLETPPPPTVTEKGLDSLVTSARSWADTSSRGGVMIPRPLFPGSKLCKNKNRHLSNKTEIKYYYKKETSRSEMNMCNRNPYLEKGFLAHGRGMKVIKRQPVLLGGGGLMKHNTQSRLCWLNKRCKSVIHRNPLLLLHFGSKKDWISRKLSILCRTEVNNPPTAKSGSIGIGAWWISSAPLIAGCSLNGSVGMWGKVG